MNERDGLAADLSDFIARDTDDEAAFDALARRVFAYQFARNAPYRAFAQGRGATPAAVRSWRDLPAAPAAAFKHFVLSCTPEGNCARVFHSSGTTGRETSRHFLDAAALDVYRTSLRQGFGRFVLPDGARLPILALMAPPEGAPHSSLSFMLGELIASGGGAFFAAPGDWQTALANALQNATGPMVVFGTAWALVHFFDATQRSFVLPPGSRVVETGGFKGRSRELSRDELYALFAARLGVPSTHCVSEYGMSEMASQFYDSTLRDAVLGVARPPRKIGAPTVRTRVLDPVTGEEAEPGVPGLLAHCDIANLNSVVAIQTEDWGYAAGDGEGFVLLGRAPGAVLRGCSLTAEEMMAPRRA